MSLCPSVCLCPVAARGTRSDNKEKKTNLHFMILFEINIHQLVAVCILPTMLVEYFRKNTAFYHHQLKYILFLYYNTVLVLIFGVQCNAGVECSGIRVIIHRLLKG